MTEGDAERVTDREKGKAQDGVRLLTDRWMERGEGDEREKEVRVG